MTFKERVYAYVQTIPKGYVMTYGGVARAIGSPHASRAVGTALANNDSRDVPCHRVVSSTMKIGHYNGILGKSKATILANEGVSVNDKNVVSAQCLYTPQR